MFILSSFPITTPSMPIPDTIVPEPCEEHFRVIFVGVAETKPNQPQSRADGLSIPCTDNDTVKIRIKEYLVFIMYLI